MTNDYWYVDIPGLTQEQAVRFREVLLPDSPLGVVLIDPSKFMVRGYERSAVELLVKCLDTCLAEGKLPHDDRTVTMSMLEDYQAWLQQSLD